MHSPRARHASSQNRSYTDVALRPQEHGRLSTSAIWCPNRPESSANRPNPARGKKAAPRHLRLNKAESRPLDRLPLTCLRGRSPELILVVGTTGNVGGAVCQALRAKNKPVRAMVRESSEPARIQSLEESGADSSVASSAIQARLRSPVAAWRRSSREPQPSLRSAPTRSALLTRWALHGNVARPRARVGFRRRHGAGARQRRAAGQLYLGKRSGHRDRRLRRQPAGTGANDRTSVDRRRSLRSRASNASSRSRAARSRSSAYRSRSSSGRRRRAAGTDAAIFPSLMLCQTRGDEIAAAPEWLRPQTTVEDYLRTVLNRAPGGRPRPSRHSRRRDRLRSLPHSGHNPGGRFSYVTRRSPRNPDQGAWPNGIRNQGQARAIAGSS
jgi:NmrA-like family